MRRSVPYVAFLAFSIAISLGFFWQASSADFSSLSGDQFNILTVCAKKDFPQMLQGDLVAGDVRNVDYYIPSFVSLVRFASLPDHNYLRGLNILLLLTSIVYMLGWWILFSLWGNRFVAAILAFLVRGLIWPPGNELWGIAGLWTMLPRTLFLALLPWALWIWLRYRKTQRGWLFACLFCGVIANVHPISGAATAAGLMTAEVTWALLESQRLRMIALRIGAGVGVISIGCAPFLWKYVSVIGSGAKVDPAEFERAVRMRVGPIFWDPFLYIEGWLRPQLLAVVVLPWIACLVFRRQLKQQKNLLVALGAFAIGCVLTALLPFAVEALLGKFGYEARFAWELVRSGKYIIAPAVIACAIFCLTLCKQIESRWPAGRTVIVACSLLVVGLTTISRYPIFDRVPFFGDDTVRFLWPVWTTNVRNGTRQENLDQVLRWIRENTTPDSKFVGPRQIRAGALRPVVHDFAGAGMLIEGNPQAFIEAAKRERAMRLIQYENPAGRVELFASWGADYWVTRDYETSVPVVYTDQRYFVYDLRGYKQRAAIAKNN